MLLHFSADREPAFTRTCEDCGQDFPAESVRNGCCPDCMARWEESVGLRPPSLETQIEIAEFYGDR